MIHFLNLTPVRAARLQLRREQFIHRHRRSGHIALLAFAAGCAFTAIVIQLTQLLANH